MATRSLAEEKTPTPDPDREHRGQRGAGGAPHGDINAWLRMTAALRTPVTILATPWSLCWSSLPALIILDLSIGAFSRPSTHDSVISRRTAGGLRVAE